MWIESSAFTHPVTSNPAKLWTADEILKIVYRAENHGSCDDCIYSKQSDYSPLTYECHKGRGCGGHDGKITHSYGFCDEWESKEEDDGEG